MEIQIFHHTRYVGIVDILLVEIFNNWILLAQGRHFVDWLLYTLR